MDVLGSNLTMDPNRGGYMAINPVPPLVGTVLPAIPAPTRVEIETDIASKRPEDFTDVRYLIHNRFYFKQMYDQFLYHGLKNEIQNVDEEFNHYREVHTISLDSQIVTQRIHIPTVMLACKELTATLEDARRHFKCTTTARLSRTDVS